MTILTLRSVKGAELTYAEHDDNHQSAVTQLSSIAILKIHTGDFDGQQVSIHSTLGDGAGGSGLLYWDASSVETEDDFTIIKVTGVTTGRWKRLNLSYYPLPQVTAGGTVNAITATFPETLVLIDGLELRVRAAGANDSATVTFSPNALTAKNVRKNGNIALVEGDIAGAGHELRFVYNSTNDVWELMNPANPNPYLVYETEVTGAAVTSIDVTGLDINKDKSYRIEVEYLNAGTAASLSLFYNNDTTVTNYYRQHTFGDGASTTSARVNNAIVIFTSSNSSICTAKILVTLNNGYANAHCDFVRDIGATIINSTMTQAKTSATESNITQLTLTDDVGSQIAIGTKVRIYRG